MVRRRYDLEYEGAGVFRGIHDIITGPPTDGMIVDLVVAHLGKTENDDPGPSFALPVRLAAIHPEPRDWYHFPDGSRKVRTHGGDAAHFYDSDGQYSFAYLEKNPSLEVPFRLCRWPEAPHQLGEAESPLDRLFIKTVRAIMSGAPAILLLDWNRSLQYDSGRQRQSLLDVLPAMYGDEWLHLEVPEYQRYYRTGRTIELFVGRNVLAVAGPEVLLVCGPADESIEAAGLAPLSIEGVRSIWEHSAPLTESKPRYPTRELGYPSIKEVTAWVSSMPATLSLDRLDDLAWHKLSHAGGRADDVPMMLTTFALCDVDEGETGYHPMRADDFEGSVLSQASVFPATAFCIPYLGGLLEDRPELAEEVLSTLSFSVHHRRGWFFGDIDELDPAEEPHPAAIWTRSALARLQPQLIQLVRSDDVGVAAGAAACLIGLHGEGRDVFGSLRASSAEGLTPALILAMAILGRADGASPEDIPMPDEAAPHALNFAWALGRCLLGDRNAVSGIVSNLHSAESLGHFLHLSNVELAMKTLEATIEGWPNSEQLDQFLGSFPADQQYRLLNELGSHIFPDGAPAAVSELSEIQSRFVDHLRPYVGTLRTELIHRHPMNPTSYIHRERIAQLSFLSAIGMEEADFKHYIAGEYDPTLKYTYGQPRGLLDPLTSVMDIRWSSSKLDDGSLVQRPSADACIWILISYFGADPDADPGPDAHLAARLAALGPTCSRTVERVGLRPLQFHTGTELQMWDTVLRFYDGYPGAQERWAYSLDYPSQDLLFTLAEDGVYDITPSGQLLERVAGNIVDNLLALAPSKCTVRWDVSDDEGDLVVEALSPLRNVRPDWPIAWHASQRDYWMVAGWNALFVRVGPGELRIYGADDEAVELNAWPFETDKRFSVDLGELDP